MSERIDIYTIGHSRHLFHPFLRMLTSNQVEHLVDVRSQPYSRRAAWSSRDDLANLLVDHLIGYTWLGGQLGGRPGPPELYRDGDLNLEAVRAWPSYQRGLEELIAIARRQPTVIMCAEEDPAHCHRKRLIAPDLHERGFRVRHIRAAPPTP